ncbi:hypothetical protein PXK30_09450 [Phaeobacter gallaeciensis]|uniref:hypothetical protein n=1 Tax=Phaeobacter gallaeciensis TaxID=60890 RepID=UPI00237EF997|nr:hypothetical protein [Phaeobacter gallaeciensis]MDE4303653.1 hypothetical protein [Phaeobacter gallaeciensis]MDE4307866.1 hypothetical protein [Phaeobacter gallaeciensis]MDE4312324.1 hypothetical protein [Phaeobacter gallaeciensis]MDE4316795.1 hypothetical protein [Phaeobacter gallaeciensis]MDE4321258.1 hypothetical protein [Phaeobacter gallaeciensis]
MSDAVAALMRELEPDQSARLTAAIVQITTAAVQRWGVAPTLAEVVATAMAKEATYGDGSSFDLENALHQLSEEAPTVVKHLSASGAADGGETVPTGRFSQSGAVSAEDIKDLPAHLRGLVREGMTAADISELNPQIRMTISRALTLDRSASKQEDTRSLSELTGADRMSLARRNGQV